MWVTASGVQADVQTDGVELAAAVGALGLALLEDPGARQLATAPAGLGAVARAVGAVAALVVQVDGDGVVVSAHEWRPDQPVGAIAVEALPDLPAAYAGLSAPPDVLARSSAPTTSGAAGSTTSPVHQWDGPLAGRLGVEGVTVVPIVRDATGQWALVLGWADRGRVWRRGWVPLLVAGGALLVGAERLAVAEARASVEEASGVANRKLFLVLVARMLARLDRVRDNGMALLACQVQVAEAEDVATSLARWLEDQLRETDLVGLFDERTVVLACEGVATPEDALALAERLAAAALADGDQPAIDGGLPSALQVSWGVVHTGVRVPPGVLLRRADTAAYQAAVTGDRVSLAEN